MTSKFLVVLMILSTIHIGVDIWCIKNILYRPLSSKSKIFWIVLIIFIPILATIAYLLLSREKGLNHPIQTFDAELEEPIKTTIFLCLFYTFQFLMIAIIYANPENMTIILLLFSALIIMMILHLYKDKIKGLLVSIMPYLLIIAITLADYLSTNHNYKVIILLAVALIIIEYPIKYVRVFIWVPLLLYQLGSLSNYLLSNNIILSDYIISMVIKNSITYTLVIGGVYFAKRQLMMNNYLKYLMKELKEKTNALEENSKVQERNRIAREIHDTLGHTLTGAIIQLEVAKQQVGKNPIKAEESIIKTQEITRQGFNEVKRAIKALRPLLIEENTLGQGLKLLFEQVMVDSNFKVNEDLDIPDHISDTLKVSLYRIIQELITNSIRHSQSSEMTIVVKHQKHMIRLESHDHGCGCSLIKESNGLRGIRERVLKLDGHANFSSYMNKGFSAIIVIPIENI